MADQTQVNRLASDPTFIAEAKLAGIDKSDMNAEGWISFTACVLGALAEGKSRAEAVEHCKKLLDS